jgi:hypothetical protein
MFLKREAGYRNQNAPEHSLREAITEFLAHYHIITRRGITKTLAID